MRGRRATASSSSVCQQTSRKPSFRDVSSDDHQTSEDTQDDDEKDELPELRLSSTRAKRRKERRDKSQSKGLSEEEEVKLALRLSEQEASVSALRLQQEEEEEEQAVRRAIHQSMINPTETWVRDRLPPLTPPSSVRSSKRRIPPEDKHPEESENRKCVKKRKMGRSPDLECLDSQSSDSTHIEDSPLRLSPVFPLTGRRPEVHIERLNRDRLQTCSQDSWTSPQTPASPEGVPVLHRPALRSPVFGEEEEAAPPSPVDQSEASHPVGFLSSSPDSSTPSVRSHNPVFPGSPPHALHHHHHHQDQLSDSKRKKWSRCNADVSSSPSGEQRAESNEQTLVQSDQDVTVTGSPSPVFPDELHENHQVTESTRGHESRSSSSDGGHSSQTVSYLWGVPFCPRGEDPDAYTQVIVDQLDFYEKSLKRAQRFLLRKAEWSAPWLPLSENSPSPEPSGRPPHPEDEQEEEEEAQREEEAEQEEVGGAKATEHSDECQVCPETPPSDAQEEPDAPEEHSELEMIPGVNPPTDEEEEQQEEQEEEGGGGGGGGGMAEEEENASKNKDQGTVSVSVREEEPQQEEEEPQQEEEEPQQEEEEEPPCSSPACCAAAVDCPLCQRAFPVGEVERHAAFCDGQEDSATAKPHRLRRKRAEAHGSRKQERCYVCGRDLPLKDYSRHVELCIQRHSNAAPAGRNLLTALEETERTGGAPSGSHPPVRDVINLLSDDDDDDDDDEEVKVSGFRVSDSPIKAFTSISDASDCLIDFKTTKSRRRRR